MDLTYRQLRDKLNLIKESEQLDQTVTVFLDFDAEFFPVSKIDVTEWDCDVLDEGHIILVVK